MKFNLADKSEHRQATEYLNLLASKGSVAEVKKISPHRTISQNAYLHLIIGAFSQHFGYTLDEGKQIYKELNAGIYRYKKKRRVFWRSSADLDKGEMAKSIDTFMQKSAEAGYPLPLATDKEWLQEIEREIERSKFYL